MDFFHQRLKETLQEKKVSQRKLAKMIGVAPQSVWEWLNESYPSLERFRQICEILNVDANFLLGLSINTGGGSIIDLLRGPTYTCTGAHCVSRHHYNKGDKVTIYSLRRLRFRNLECRAANSKFLERR